jgi:hypothetical protein
MPSFRVLTGIQYKGKEALAGDVVDDIPQADQGWLQEQGHIEKVTPEKKAAKKAAPTAESSEEGEG